MLRIVKWIKKETLHILPAVLYFFIAGNLFCLTFGWMLKEEGVRLANFSSTVIGAIIIGKVILVVDATPLLNMFSNRPLIYNTIWKTTIYFLFTFFFRTIEHLVPFMMKYKGPAIAWQHMMSEVWWARFWTIQTWMLILLLIFVLSQELVTGVGLDKLRKMFFGR